MRILMTTDTVGGVWTFTQELVTGLLEADCEVALISFGRKPSCDQQSWIDGMQCSWREKFTYTASEVALEWMQHNENAYSAAAPFLLELADVMQADILHTNQFCFGAVETRIPKVVTAHSDVFSWTNSCRQRPLEPSAWLDRYRQLVSIGLSGASTVTAPTHWMLRALAQSFTLFCETKVIPNGKSIAPFLTVDRKLQAVIAGRLWDEAKDIAMLAPLESPMPILAAGESSYDAASSPSMSGVKLLGGLTQQEMSSLFGQSAIYICTSKYEPFGLAPLEAALCGCAVVANDIDSLREVWGSAALYFNDAASLKALLQDLTQNADLLAARQAESKTRALTFSRKKMTAAYLDVYGEAIAKAHQNRMAHVA